MGRHSRAEEIPDSVPTPHHARYEAEALVWLSEEAVRQGIPTKVLLQRLLIATYFDKTGKCSGIDSNGYFCRGNHSYSMCQDTTRPVIPYRGN